MSKETKEIDLYEKLLAKFKDSVILGNALSTIYWDMETYMPEKGIQQRSEQIAMISGLIHEKNVDPEIGTLLQEIKAHKNFEKLAADQKRNIYLLQRDYDQNTKLPMEFVKTFAKESALAMEIWKKALAESNYELFKPELVKIIELAKQRAKYLDPTKDPLDVLIDLNEPGFTTEILDKLFSELRDGLVPLIKKCVESKNQPDYSKLERECPLDIQKQFSNEIAELVKYDLKRGRIDETVHPFTTGFYDDVRITTRYFLNDFTSSFFAVLHEAGHGLYDLNMPIKYKYQPIGFCSSSGVHESQSRFIENIVGRSIEFWKHYFPRFKELTGEIFADLEFDDFIRAINKVTPSFIRVEADPVTYSMHIIIRHEIEKEIFSGKLSVDDLPKVWNQKYKEYLGIDVKNDAEGVLQDIHWSGGEFGGFPSYSIGNIMDGQLLWKMEQDIPDWREQVKKGEIGKIVDWLATNVHQKGNMYDPFDLIKEVTGEELSTKYYLDYLKAEFAKFYDI
ncbi:MAG: carboxypeptidase M32 [Candidatus Heimdallarchaeota archaeon]